MKITIDVTQEDINKGIRDNESRCPVAKAIRRTFNGAKNIQVGTAIVFDLQNIHYSADLPKKLNTFISNFDHKGKKAVKPIKSAVIFKTT